MLELASADWQPVAISLTRLDPYYRVFFKDGDRVDVPADPDAVREVFESYETGAGAVFDTYLDESQFVYEDRPRFRDWVDTDVLQSLPAAALARSMDDYVGDFFDHPKLQQLVQCTLVFLGGSPYNTPALYTLMSHVDYNLGVYYPDGGLYSVVKALVELATSLGVTIETAVDVTGILPVSTGGLQLETTTGARVDDAGYRRPDVSHQRRARGRCRPVRPDGRGVTPLTTVARLVTRSPTRYPVGGRATRRRRRVAPR